MRKSWTIKTPEGDRDFETPQQAAEYLKCGRVTLPEKAAPVSVVPEYSSRAAKVDEVKSEAIPALQKRTLTRRTELTAPSRSAGLTEFDFSNFTLAELDEIIDQANEAKRTFVDRRRARLLAELEELDALEKGRHSPSKKKRRKETKPRTLRIYQDEKGNSWRGSGRKPSWLVERLENGASINDFLVKPSKK